MFEIDKQFDFCYGHRVWTQNLNAEYSLDSQCKCRHLHGHQGTVKIHLEADRLEYGMVTDFKHLNWMKKFLDDHIDHKFIVDFEDPNFNRIVGSSRIKTQALLGVTLNNVYAGGGILAGHSLTCDPEYVDATMAEHFESFFIVQFVPTSENLAKWLYDLVSIKMELLSRESKNRFSVAKVEWYETPKSRSVYTR